jgi:hypothetical protein
MVKRALLIANVDLADVNNAGVALKINGQAQALRDDGLIVDTVYNIGTNIVLNKKTIKQLSGLSIQRKLTWFSHLQQIDIKAYNLIWLRHQVCTPSMITFLDTVRQDHPDITIIMDMPTYPYDQEWSGLLGYAAMSMDRHYRSKLKDYVDLVTHSGPEREIFDIPTVSMTNGIDVDQFEEAAPEEKDHTHILAIGKWRHWHGLDRILAGWDNQAKATLHVVGDGASVPRLKSLCTEHKLSNIRFYGPLTGPPLDELARQCHIAIGTLGIHRKGVLVNSSLKHREYCSRGIPFIYSSDDPDFKNCTFALKVTADDVPIPIAQLLEFDKRCRDQNLRSQMRPYATEQLSWRQKISQVLAAV